MGKEGLGRARRPWILVVASGVEWMGWWFDSISETESISDWVEGIAASLSGSLMVGAWLV
jgi:hypothetical protein